MDPISMALALGSTALSAGGSLFAGFSNAAAGRLQSEIARGNAELLGKTAASQALDAPLALQRGAFEERKLHAHIEDVLGAQLSGYAAMGIDPTYGSPLHLQFMTAAQGAVDAGLIRAQARFDEASAFGRAASTRQAQAGQSAQAYASAEGANNALIAGYIGAATTLLKFGAQATSPGPGGTASPWASLTGTGTPAASVTPGGGFTPAIPAIGQPMQINAPVTTPSPYNPYRLYY